MIKLSSNIKDDIKTQKTRYKDVLDLLQPQVTEIITPDFLSQVERIYLVGCGDSLFASLGARLFFEQVTGLPIEVQDAMEFSRYTCQNIPKGSLMIAVSNSGRVSRLVEAIIQARKRGVTTLALTAHAERGAAENAHAKLVAALPNIRTALESMSTRVEQVDQDKIFNNLSEPGMVAKSASSLGMGSGLDFLLFMLGAYANSLFLLYTSAIQIGLVRGCIDTKQANDYQELILNSVDILVKTAHANLEPIYHLAERFKEKNAFLFLGSGPSYGVACLSAAKLFEQPHLNGVAQYVEEWAHLQFFFTRPDGVPIFVIVPPGASRDRALEQIEGIKQLGGTVLAICDVNDHEIKQAVDEALLIQGELPEAFTPWVYGVPGQILALTLLDIKGLPPIPKPYSFKHMMEVNFKQIYGSTINTD